MTVEVPRYNLVDTHSTEVNAMFFSSFSYRKKSLHRRDNSNYLYYGTVNLMYSIKELLSGSKHNFCHSSKYLAFHLSACIQNRCHKTCPIYPPSDCETDYCWVTSWMLFLQWLIVIQIAKSEDEYFQVYPTIVFSLQIAKFYCTRSWFSWAQIILWPVAEK